MKPDDDTSNLTKLGSQGTQYQYDSPSPDTLETFPNPQPDRDYEISHVTDEFSSLCPKTGQPDFAHLSIRVIPDEKCVESKSLKLYLFSYRNHGAFMERIANTILNHLVEVCSPRWCQVEMTFGTRGGITTSVKAEHKQ